MFKIRGSQSLLGNLTLDNSKYHTGESNPDPKRVLVINSRESQSVSSETFEIFSTTLLQQLAYIVDKGLAVIEKDGVVQTSDDLKQIITDREDNDGNNDGGSVDLSDIEMQLSDHESRISSLEGGGEEGGSVDLSSVNTRLDDLESVDVGINTRLGIVEENYDTAASRDAAIASVFGWQIGYDANLTQMSNFTFVDGANSWNGKTWTGEGIAARTDSFGVVNGTGLVLNHNAQNTAWAMSADTAPKIWISLASLIPNFIWGQHELRVTADFEVNGSATYDLAGISIEKAFVANQTCTHKLYAGYVPGYQRYGQVLMENAEAGGYLFPVAEKVNRIYMRNPIHVQYLSRASAAASPTDSNTVAFGSDGGFSVYGIYAGAFTGRIKNASDARLVIAAQTGNTNNQCVLTVRRLRVEYKAA